MGKFTFNFFTVNFILLQIRILRKCASTMSSPKKTGIQAPLNMGDQLSKIIGTAKGEQVSRPPVVKKLWDYLKKNNLQDPENKQWFTPDKTMQPIFGKEKIKCFSMSKYLKEHLTNPNK